VQSKAFDGKAAREAKRALLAADAKKNEEPTVRDAMLDALKQAAYFIHQVHWLHSRFPHGRVRRRTRPVQGRHAG
jgi:type I restriction enzyme M protein